MYLLFKSLHLIAMVCWFAGLFYLFRIFVYMVENKDQGKTVEVLTTMSRKLYYYITWPSMLITWICGIGLLSQAPSVARAPWFHAKLALLVLLVAYHLFIGRTYRRFAAGDFYLSSKQCRLLNEIPVVFLICIVALAVFKPF